jgi:hypothetical protein
MARSYTLPLGAVAKRLSTVYGASYADRVIADGASNYWRLGEPSGTTAVDAVGGANGTISGGVTLNQPGAIGDGTKAMTFDGTTGKVVTAVDVTTPVICTIEAWIKSTLGGGQAAFYSTRSTGQLGLTLYVGVIFTGGKLVPFLYSGEASNGTRHVGDGSWHHVVFVLSGAICTVYVDGTLDTAVSQNRATTGTGKQLIGWDEATAGFWSGALDEVAVYPRALTAPEIAAHYQLGSVPPVDPAVTDIPYRELVLQVAGADAYIGADSTVSPTNYGLKAAVVGQSTVGGGIGPFDSGPVKLSDFWAVGGAGATLHIVGIPY